MQFKLKPLSEQTIIITGATSGIGQSAARRTGLCSNTVFTSRRNFIPC